MASVNGLSGLSPRGRGNRGTVASGSRWRGSIPAWAGEPSSTPGTPKYSGVYPRVGGGTAARLLVEAAGAGLSPRGRGNHRLPPERPSTPGSIPAWAGEPACSLISVGTRRVYPRVGGGTASTSARKAAVSGLSPRGRGNLDKVIWHIVHRRSIPAWAGEPLPLCLQLQVGQVYPRVGGGTFATMSTASGRAGLSPRGRGNPYNQPRLHKCARARVRTHSMRTGVSDASFPNL